MRKRSADLDVNEPELPWQRKTPKKMELYFGYGPTANHQFISVDDLFPKIYFDPYDNAIKAIEDRFNQQDFKNYAALQELILYVIKGEKYEEHLEIIKTVYGDDLNYILLDTQLELLPETFENGVSDVEELLGAYRNLDKAKRTLLSEVMKVVKLIIVLPATNAVSERSFSALKLFKVYHLN